MGDKMKKLILLLIFSTTLVGQNEAGNFKITGGDIECQKVYEEDLDIEPQTIFFAKPDKTLKVGVYIASLEQADLYVDRKDGRTRLRVRNFLYRPQTLAVSVDLERASNIAIKLNRKGFRKSFIDRDAPHLDLMIMDAIEDLFGNGDDW